MAKSAVKQKSAKKSGKKASSIGIQKTDTLGTVIETYPEVAPVLAQAGLHCIGCHVSGYESIEQGCLAHGMSKSDIEELIKMANKRIADYEALPKISFTDKAFSELLKRKGTKKLVRLTQIFGGDFDFEAADKLQAGEVLVDAGAGKEKFSVAASNRIERMLRGVKIDYDPKQKDFVANRD